jgi:V/A-type H+-transporting ATPase subunit C
MDDYAYANARIHAMQGLLFSEAHYEALLGQETFDGVVDGLKSSPYDSTLEHIPSAPPPSLSLQRTIPIDEAMRRDLTRNLAKLRRLFSDRPLELLDALFLRWDVYNLKTVLHGKRAAAPVEDILTATMPVGTLDEPALAELARAPTMHGVADLLEGWRFPLAQPVRTWLNRLGETDSLQRLELELNRFAFARASRLVAHDDDNAGTVRNYLECLVDKTNMLTALRYLAEKSVLSELEASQQFLKAEGRFSRAHFDALIGARDLSDGFSRLAETPYRWLARTLAEGDRVSLPQVERRLDGGLLRRMMSCARREPLGIGVAAAYIERKTNEVRNLRVILQGKASGMSTEQISEWLIT